MYIVVIIPPKAQQMWRSGGRRSRETTRNPIYMYVPTTPLLQHHRSADKYLDFNFVPIWHEVSRSSGWSLKCVHGRADSILQCPIILALQLLPLQYPSLAFTMTNHCSYYFLFRVNSLRACIAVFAYSWTSGLEIIVRDSADVQEFIKGGKSAPSFRIHC
jgi:hypothetical protein